VVSFWRVSWFQPRVSCYSYKTLGPFTRQQLQLYLWAGIKHLLLHQNFPASSDTLHNFSQAQSLKDEYLLRLGHLVSPANFCRCLVFCPANGLIPFHVSEIPSTLQTCACLYPLSCCWDRLPMVEGCRPRGVDYCSDQCYDLWYIGVAWMSCVVSISCLEMCCVCFWVSVCVFFSLLAVHLYTLSHPSSSGSVGYCTQLYSSGRSCAHFSSSPPTAKSQLSSVRAHLGAACILCWDKHVSFFFFLWDKHISFLLFLVRHCSTACPEAIVSTSVSYLTPKHII